MARPNPLAFLSVSSFVFRLLVMVGKQPWYERHKAPTVPITFNHLMSKYIYIYNTAFDTFYGGVFC